MALFVAVALVVFENSKSVVLGYGAVQAARFIEWGFREHISSHTCITIDSIDQQSVEISFSVFEREEVWSESQSFVFYYISPLFGYPLYFGPCGLINHRLLLLLLLLRVSASRQRRTSVHGRDGGSGTRYTNSRPVLRRGRGTFA